MIIKEYENYDENEILALYSSVGWTAYTDAPDTLRCGFKNSLLILAAHECGKLVGLIRCVGDGETIVYIQDILVLPVYHRQGIGSTLLREALSRFAHVRQIVLSTDREERTVHFYKSLGFTQLEDIGCCSFMYLK